MIRSKKTSSSKLVSNINVVPYIDVMLVLLVIFMATAPLLTEGIYVDLPKADGESTSASKKNSRIIVSVNAGGEVFTSVNGSQSKQVSKDELRQQVITQFKKNNRTEVYVKGDKSVLYETVVGVMSLLQESGVPNIGLITQAPEKR